MLQCICTFVLHYIQYIERGYEPRFLYVQPLSISRRILYDCLHILRPPYENVSDNNSNAWIERKKKKKKDAGIDVNAISFSNSCFTQNQKKSQKFLRLFLLSKALIHFIMNNTVVSVFFGYYAY